MWCDQPQVNLLSPSHQVESPDHPVISNRALWSPASLSSLAGEAAVLAGSRNDSAFNQGSVKLNMVFGDYVKLASQSVCEDDVGAAADAYVFDTQVWACGFQLQLAMAPSLTRNGS